jgi:hypothetical protein
MMAEVDVEALSREAEEARRFHICKPKITNTIANMAPVRIENIVSNGATR